MSNNSQQQSFWKLIQSNKIEIPIIQRDYAQGRPDKKEVRDNFLNDLLNALSENKPLELDFVYGDIHNGVFQPLDGQQRLTTLFLLHWYVAVKENKLEKHANELSKFTYQTRASSREFCTALIEKGEIDLHKLLPSDRNKGNELSKTIIDSPWFFLSWQKDPTIKAMLIMLDAIHEKISALIPYNDLWGKLTEQHIITFHHLTLEGLGLSDDLYIKMNARGKALTDFENFKARFEQYIKQVIYKTDKNGKEILENGEKVILKDNWEKNLTLNDKNKDQWTKLTKETFAHKIDTVWTDLFWKYKNDQNSIDDALLRFIAGIAVIGYARSQATTSNGVIPEANVKSKGTDNSINIENGLAVFLDKPSKLKPEDFLSQQTFDYLTNILDIYSGKEKSFDQLRPKDLPLWDFIKKENSSLFVEIIKNSGKIYKQRTLFFAQTEYLIKQGDNFNSEHFSDWMRVVRNIVQNTTIDSPESLKKTIGLIRELSVGCDNIYDYLSKNELKSDFGSKQTEEEKLKARWIGESDVWRASIFKAEDHPLFQGRIDFLLSKGLKKEFNLDTFNHRLNNAEMVFDAKGIREEFNKEALFLRAFVSRIKNGDHLWGIYYDGTRDTWKDIFKREYLWPALLEILDANPTKWITFLNESSGLEKGNKFVHEELYKSELLASITANGCKLRYWLSQFIMLRPSNAKDNSKKYIIGVKRNRLLFDLYLKGECEPKNPDNDQHLIFNGKKIPFFWGMDIPIKYKNEIIVWKNTHTFIIKGEEYTLNDDELDDLPKKWDELLAKTNESANTIETG